MAVLLFRFRAVALARLTIHKGESHYKSYVTTRLIYIIENFNRNSFCVGRGLAWPTQIWSRSFPPRATAWQISSLRNSNLILVRGDSAAVIHAKCVFSRVCNHNQIRFLAIKHDGVRVWSDCES